MILLKPHLYQETFFSIGSPRISYFLSELQLQRLCVNDCACMCMCACDSAFIWSHHISFRSYCVSFFPKSIPLLIPKYLLMGFREGLPKYTTLTYYFALKFPKKQSVKEGHSDLPPFPQKQEISSPWEEYPPCTCRVEHVLIAGEREFRGKKIIYTNLDISSLICYHKPKLLYFVNYSRIVSLSKGYKSRFLWSLLGGSYFWVSILTKLNLFFHVNLPLSI